MCFLGGCMKKTFYFVAFATIGLLQNFSYVPQASAQASIRLSDSYVHPDYIEVEQIRDTKSIIVIRKQDIEQKGYTTISDVLKDIPSINVNTTGLGDIDIRGQGEGQSVRNIQVLLDGAPITILTNHPLSSNYDVVPVEQIEKIEIIPGGGSVLYGSGASGGIINITTTAKTRKKHKNTFSLEQNSDGARYNLNIGGKIKAKTNFDVAYAKLRRDLYFVDTYRNSEYFSLATCYDVSKKEDIRLNYSHLDEKSQYIANINAYKLKFLGKNYRPPIKEQILGLDKDGHKIIKLRRDYLIGDRNLDTLTINYQKKIDDKWSFSNDFFYNQGTYRNIQDEYKKMDHSARGVRLKADYNYGKKNTLLLGLDYYTHKANIAYDDYKTVNRKKQIFKKHPLHFYYEKKIGAIYLLNVLKNGKYSFTQGLRKESLAWHYDKLAAKTAGKDKYTRLNTAAEISLAYHYNQTGKVYARYEHGYTSPDGVQITDDRPIDGEIQLAKTLAEDEHFNIYEIGMRDKIGMSTINLTLFASNTNNQMNRFFFLSEAGFVRQTMNLLQTHRQGVELSLMQKLGKMTLEESYAYLYGHSDYNANGRKFIKEHEDFIGSVDWTRSGLMKVPRHKASIKLQYDVDDRFNFGIDYIFFGSYNNFFQDADKADHGIVSSHALVDVNLKYKARSDMEFYGGVTNLFDKKYYENVGQGFYTIIPGRTRTIFGAMKYTF